MILGDNTPYVLGYMSYYSQVPRISNPYPTNSKEWEEWNRGWDQAQSEAEGSEE